MKTRKKIVIVFMILLANMAVAEYVPLKVELTSLERIMVGQMLPEKASFVNWKIINDLKNELSFTAEERKMLDIRPAPEGQEGVSARWDAVPVKEIIFNEITEKFVVDALEKLDKDAQLVPEHISLYEKFVLKK